LAPDRDSTAALIPHQPAAPAPPPAAAAEAPAPSKVPAPIAKPKVGKAAPAKTAAPARGTQISTAYEQSAPTKKPRVQKRNAQSERKTAQSSQRKQWDTRRQGLRTSAPTSEVSEVEPSTMVKLLKSLNPFASKEESQARPRKNIFE
jgi:hypothetical protein